MSISTPQPDGEMYCPTCEKAFTAKDVCPNDGSRLVSLVAQRDPFVGRDLDGRYLVAEKLGHGGMGAVYRGTQTSVGREVAIKVVNSAMIGEPEVIKRFLREAKLASKLNHPHAVSVVDFGQTRDGVFYLVMELIRGQTLAQIIIEKQRLSAERTISIGLQVLSALEGAHAVPIVHRDLKPPNIMVGPDDFVKVLDFGIAKSIAPDTIGTTMTNAGALLGTPHFMPPEIANGGDFDGRADIYSLGCILYLLVEGRLPFNADTLPELLQQHMYKAPPPMRHAPLGLARVIQKMLAKDPARRYTTATIARNALERSPTANTEELLTGPTDQLQAVTTEQSAKPKARWPLITGCVLAISAGVGAAVVVGRSGPAMKPPPAAVEPTPIVEPIPDPKPDLTVVPAPVPPTPPPTPSVPTPTPTTTTTTTVAHPARPVAHPPKPSKPSVHPTPTAPPRPEVPHPTSTDPPPPF
jgi:serine/threonine protein kinase